MPDWTTLRLICAVVLAAALVMPGAHAETGAPLGDAAALRDFLIQDVCLDAGGAVLPAVSPLDTGCSRRRDLRPGERLPYHKHDQPAPDDAGAAPLGYHRRDSFPVETALYGVVVEQSSDFGFGDGRRFGVFDAGSDGGDIVILSSGAAAIAATEDGGAGFQLFAGACQGRLTAAALAHSWIVAQLDQRRPASLTGETVARLDDLTRGHQAACPAHLNAAFTRWHVAPFRYRALAGQGRPATLTTLVSEHYGGASPASADHVERFYFTRELGGTRWERWQNAAGNPQISAADIARMAARFAATSRCSPAAMPPGGATLVLVDCREWTRIVPAADPAGDPPGFFIAAIRRRADLPRLFDPPGGRR